MTRRDKVYLLAKRGMLLPYNEKASAWNILMDLLDRVGEKQMPKFKDIIWAVRSAQIQTRKVHRDRKLKIDNHNSEHATRTT